MIGQISLRNNLKDIVESGKFPRFVILTGPKGSGKKLICEEIAHYLGVDNVIMCGIKVEDIRDIIDAAYRVTTTTVYVVADADNMSLAAKNAMLKIMEEPPNNAYFIMTINDLSQTLETIRSRGTVFRMNNYTPSELLEYAGDKITNDEKVIIANVCETPLEVDTIINSGITDFYDYVKLVVDNIAEVSGSNSFKISQKISFKDDPDKYDLMLFWKSFMQICTERISTDPVRYAIGVRTTSKYLQQLFITGINKQSVFDMWLLEIRSFWME